MIIKLRKSIWLIIMLFLVVLIGGCGTKALGKTKKQEIIVFAASSLTESLEEIVNLFEEENPDIDIKLNLDSSSRLRVQIEQGIETDIFLSANQKHYDALQEEAYISKGEVLLHNSMVVIVPKDNPGNIEGLEDLQNKCKLVIAQKEVPAGEYGRKIIHSMSGELGPEYETKVLDNIVSEEANVKQVVNKVVLGEADAAFVYSSDVTQTVKDKVKVLKVPLKHNVKAEYWIGELNKENKNQYVEKFYEFLIGEKGQQVFLKYGFDDIHK